MAAVAMMKLLKEQLAGGNFVSVAWRRPIPHVLCLGMIDAEGSLYIISY